MELIDVLVLLKRLLGERSAVSGAQLLDVLSTVRGTISSQRDACRTVGAYAMPCVQRRSVPTDQPQHGPHAASLCTDTDTD